MTRLPSVHPRDDRHQTGASDAASRARAGARAGASRAINSRVRPASTATTAVATSTGSADQETPTRSAAMAATEINPTLARGAYPTA